MSIDTERLLRLVADYHSFCSDEDMPAMFFAPAEDELSEDELELVAAAASGPLLPDERIFRKRHSE